MDEIGLFPLPVVLLPGERLPLHIFEERYRELIEECLATDREFGLLLADNDGRREVGTRAAVVEVLERFEDGRLNVLVEGRTRFRLAEPTAGRSFATALVETVEDEDEEEAAPAAELTAAAAALARVAELTGADAPQGASGSFELATHVQLEPRLKQRLLELRAERERLRLLARILTEAARMLEATRERAEAGARNGRPAAR